MATERLVVARDAVVVAVEPGRQRAIELALGQRGEVTSLGSAGLTLLRLAKEAASSRELWSALVAGCADAAWIAPVLRDSSGSELFPTGTVVVRFRDRPGEKALAAFAHDHGLAIERRNEFVPEQVSFRPLRPRDVFLPDLVDRLLTLPGVEVAWASTVSHYRHADGRGPGDRQV